MRVVNTDIEIYLPKISLILSIIIWKPNPSSYSLNRYTCSSKAITAIKIFSRVRLTEISKKNVKIFQAPFGPDRYSLLVIKKKKKELEATGEAQGTEGQVLYHSNNNMEQRWIRKRFHFKKMMTF